MENEGQKQLGAWWRLWVAPRQTIRMLIDSCPNHVIIWLAIINGLISGLFWVETFIAFYPNAPLSLLYALCLIGGGIVGIIQLYVVSWLYTIVGRWIGGKGTYREVKCAVGWSFYPFIVSGLLGVLSGLAMASVWLQSILGLLGLVAFIWGLVILFRIVAEAHRFHSAWRGLAAVVIALLLVLGCFFLLAFVEALIL